MLNSSWSGTSRGLSSVKNVHLYERTYMNIYTYMYLETNMQACTVQIGAQSLNAPHQASAKTHSTKQEHSSDDVSATFAQFLYFSFFFFLSFSVTTQRQGPRHKDKDHHTTTRRQQDETATPTRRPRHSDSHHDSDTRRRRDGKDHHKITKRQEHNLKRRHYDSDHDNNRDKDMSTTT